MEDGSTQTGLIRIMIIDLLHNSTGITLLQEAFARFGEGKERFAPGTAKEMWDEVAKHISWIEHFFPNAATSQFGFGSAEWLGILF